MKRALKLANLALIVFSLIGILSPQLEAQYSRQNRDQQPQEGACFYRNVNYRGASFCMSVGDDLRNIGNRNNDRISSIRIFGRAQVIVYDQESFNSAGRTITGDVSDLGNWNTRIAAIRVQSDNMGYRNSRNDLQNGVCFYMDPNYRGEKFCVDGNENQQNLDQRYNDKISSIRIFGRAEVTVYVDRDFNGSRQAFRQDAPNLNAWNDKITSFQVSSDQYDDRYGGQYGDRSGGQYGGRDRDQYGNRSGSNTPRNGACFYRDADYSGESFCMNAGEKLQDVGDRFNDIISSIRIFGRTQVVVYDNKNMGGASRTFNGDVSNLVDNFNDKISSIETR